MCARGATTEVSHRTCLVGLRMCLAALVLANPWMLSAPSRRARALPRGHTCSRAPPLCLTRAAGLRALELLSYLSAAEEVTGEQKYRTTAEELRGEHGYAQMMVNAKITDPCDDNHSDDEEAFLPLYTYLQAHARLGRVRDAEFNHTLARLCRITRPESASLYLAVCAHAAGTSAPTALADNLRGWPLELISWSTRNSGRADLRHQAAPFGEQATSAIPSRDAQRFRWNANPYQMDTEGHHGLREADPSGFLLAYWMARYHQLLGPA